MKNSIKMTLIATGFALLTSCEKEIAMPLNYSTESQSSNQISDFNESTLAYTTPIKYNTCGMTVNVFSPNEYLNRKYSFALNSNGQNKPIHISNSNIYFNSPDRFSFEFAGYAYKSLTAKTWRIKRTDGLYLTSHNGNLSYSAKLIGIQEFEQIFMLSSLGNNIYKVLLPKLPVCNIVAINRFDDSWDGYNYSIRSHEYNSGNQDNSNITMIAIDPILTK